MSQLTRDSDVTRNPTPTESRAKRVVVLQLAKSVDAAALSYAQNFPHAHRNGVGGGGRVHCAGHRRGGGVPSPESGHRRAGPWTT